MGLDMMFLVVERAHLQDIPPLDRERRLAALEFPDDEQGDFTRGVV
ncbi:hypothetical protein ACQB60_35005 [Actinomycetota bacterium Odt1-20B]